MKDKLALLFLTVYMLMAPVSEASDNTIGTKYELWDKGISICPSHSILPGGQGCRGTDGKAATYQQYITDNLKGDYEVRVVGLDFQNLGVIIHYVYILK